MNHFCKVWACASALLALVLDAEGQLVNSWTNSASSQWESPSWSLGVLPSTNQTVTITNAGYKGVGIDSATLLNHPESLTVSNLVVSAPTNSLSTLLLNYVGMAAPLKVLRGCTIGKNGTLQNSESRFEADGANGGELILDGGTFVQEGGLTVVNGPVLVRNQGSFKATNGNLTLGEVKIGSAPESLGSFIQDGGSIAAQRIDVSGFTLTPFERGGYELVSGVLYAIDGTWVSAIGPGFRQFGGTNYGDITATDGYYSLLSGMAQGAVLTAASADQTASLFYQGGGLVDMQTINMTGGRPWFAGGTVHCGTLNIGGNALVEMRGTDFYVTNNFDLHGMESATPACMLWGGTLHLPSMSLGSYAFFNGMGGSNRISGGLSMFGGRYGLYGGTLETAYTGVGAAADFGHEGGLHLINGVLSISGTYALNGASAQGCNLLCQGLYLRGTMAMTRYYNGRYFEPSATFTNTGVLNLGGTIRTELPDVEAGQVQLASNALIDLSASFPAVVRFQNSSALDWTAGALLVITNWSSSDHVFVGNDASGLTASQLQQIQFPNPAGSAPGTYPAYILSTGEIVPVQPPMLAAERSSNALVLTWPGNYQLTSATNVTGPYLPVSGASSPWTNFFHAPQQFFRLQPSP